ncbi:MAG: ABC transporter permease [Clostridiales bacterium]|nr:ABC transporter permease [Clostridiales bacterium]
MEKKKIRGNSNGALVMKRLFKKKSAVAGMVIVALLILSAIAAPLLTPYSSTEIDLLNAYATPSLAHWCGCDDLGRDILTRLLYGGRYSIAIGVLSAALSTVLGLTIGAIAGFFGGRTDMIIMRIMDVFQAIPSMLLSILIAAVLGSGFGMTVLALGISGMSGIVRMSRASILSVREMEYIEAATAINCGTRRTIIRHVMPNAIAPVLVNISNLVSNGVLQAAGLSYIGLGVQPPTPEWGAMLTAGRNYIRSYPHMVLFPGIAICIFILAFNLFSDALRDALDPKLKK